MANRVCGIEDKEDQFSALKLYFGSLRPEQLINEDLESFVEFAKPEHKILMSVFVHQYLIPNVQSSDQAVQVRKISFENGKLNARGCLKSRSFPFSPNLCISDFKKAVQRLIPELSSSTIDFVDLSANNLLSGDLPLVYDFLKFLNPYLQHGSIVSLESNRIHGVGDYREVIDKFVPELANLTNVGYINLKTNPFCSVDRLDFFKALGAEDLMTKKLIWVEKYNLSGQGWTNLVKSQEVANSVRDTHSKYYKQLDELP